MFFSDVTSAYYSAIRQIILNIPTTVNLSRKGTFTKRDKVIKPVVVKIPEEAHLHQRAWVRLTALARGHLTRRLLRTDKVENIKRTIKETVACAVNLHLESGDSENETKNSVLTNNDRGTGNFNTIPMEPQGTNFFENDEVLLNFDDGVELTEVTKNYRDMIKSLKDFKE